MSKSNVVRMIDDPFEPEEETEEDEVPGDEDLEGEEDLEDVPPFIPEEEGESW